MLRGDCRWPNQYRSRRREQREEEQSQDSWLCSRTREQTRCASARESLIGDVAGPLTRRHLRIRLTEAHHPARRAPRIRSVRRTQSVVAGWCVLISMLRSLAQPPDSKVVLGLQQNGAARTNPLRPSIRRGGMEVGAEIAMDLDRGVDNRFGDVVEVSHCSSCKCSPLRASAPPRDRVKVRAHGIRPSLPN